MTFQFDTSGGILCATFRADQPWTVYWSDLSPFVQGYVEAMFAGLRATDPVQDIAGLARMSPELREQKKALHERCHWSRHAAWQSRCDQMVLLGLIVVVARGAGDTVTEPTDLGKSVLTLLLAFSDLAPETLARIMEDCEQRLRSRDCVLNSAEGGRSFWLLRQAGQRPGFPPLIVHLNNDGKIYFKD